LRGSLHGQQRGAGLGFSRATWRRLDLAEDRLQGLPGANWSLQGAVQVIDQPGLRWCPLPSSPRGRQEVHQGAHSESRALTKRAKLWVADSCLPGQLLATPSRLPLPPMPRSPRPKAPKQPRSKATATTAAHSHAPATAASQNTLVVAKPSRTLRNPRLQWRQKQPGLLRLHGFKNCAKSSRASCAQQRRASTQT